MSFLFSCFFFQGFLLSLGLLAAIGPQNAFILRQCINGRHVFMIAFISSLADAFLISLGVLGLGDLFAVTPLIRSFVKWGSVFFLFAYGFYLLFFSSKSHPFLEDTKSFKKTASIKTLFALLGFIFLNPKVYLDTIVILGSIGSGLQGSDRTFYLSGAILASSLWFFGLSYGSRLLLPILNRPNATRRLDIGVGCVMWVVMSFAFFCD